MSNTAAAEAAIAKTIKELYGDETKIIVLNKRDGVVSIGFGENGNEGGMAIPRSRLPIILTNEYSADHWRKSSDFRRALTKGWLEVISEEKYDQMMAEHQKREERLKKLAALDKNIEPNDVEIRKYEDDDSRAQPHYIDEDSATVRTDLSPDQQRFLAYENQDFEMLKGPDVTEDPGVKIIGDTISSRALALVEGCKKGDITASNAIAQLDEDSKLYTEQDLQHIADMSPYKGLSKFAKQLLTSK